MRKKGLAVSIGGRQVMEIQGLVLVIRLLARNRMFMRVQALRTLVLTRAICETVAHLGMFAISLLTALSDTIRIPVMVLHSKVLAFNKLNLTSCLGTRVVLINTVNSAVVGVIKVENSLADVVIVAILVTAAISARVVPLQISAVVLTVVAVAIHPLQLLLPAIRRKQSPSPSLLFPSITTRQLLRNVRHFSSSGWDHSLRLIKLVSGRTSHMLRTYRFICYPFGCVSC